MPQAPLSVAAATGAAHTLTRAGERVATVARRAAAIRPVYVLVPLVLAQWAMTAAIALTTTHNGWLFYHGGDGTYYWTTTWSLSHHRLPETVISYGLPVALWPLGLVFGTSMLAALPAVVGFQVLLLGPLGIVAMFGLAGRLGGRLFGYAAVVVWILAPAITLWTFSERDPAYASKLHEFILPIALGLSTIADYTSMILTLGAMYLVVRAIDDRRWDDVVLAGLATGALIAVKPSNSYFLVAPFLAFVLSRRWREGLVFFALLAPALITLVVWKRIGLGHIPAFSTSARVAAPAGGMVPSSTSLDRYFRFDWDTFRRNFDDLRYLSRSFWLIEWLTIGGLIGLIRRAPAYGIAIGAWFGAYLLFKGGASGLSTIVSTNFFRFVMPAFPAFVLIAVSIVFLAPGIPRRARAAAVPTPPTRLALVAVLVLAVYPFALIATAKPWSPGHVVHDAHANLLVPISNELQATASLGQGDVTLRWNAPRDSPSTTHYRVFRAYGADCGELSAGARDCVLMMDTIGTTDDTVFVDHPSDNGAGTTYRIGLAAGWDGTPENADLLLIGPPVQIEHGAVVPAPTQP